MTPILPARSPSIRAGTIDIRGYRSSGAVWDAFSARFLCSTANEGAADFAGTQISKFSKLTERSSHLAAPLLVKITDVSSFAPSDSSRPDVYTYYQHEALTAILTEAKIAVLARQSGLAGSVVPKWYGLYSAAGASVSFAGEKETVATEGRTGANGHSAAGARGGDEDESETEVVHRNKIWCTIYEDAGEELFSNETKDYRVRRVPDPSLCSLNKSSPRARPLREDLWSTRPPGLCLAVRVVPV